MATVIFLNHYVNCRDVDDILFKKQVNEIFSQKAIKNNLIKNTSGQILIGNLVDIYSPNYKYT